MATQEKLNMNYTLGIPIALLVLSSCLKKDSTEQQKITVAFEKNREAFFNNLRSPTELADQLKASAVEYHAGLIHDPKGVASYTVNEVKAAANLGIYLADLNYSVVFNQPSSTQELFSAAHSLSKIIGLEQDVLAFLLKRYEANLEQNDSVKVIMNELFEKATAGLRGTDREKLVGITMAAYEIENLHLLLGTLSAFPKDMNAPDNYIQAVMPLFRMVLQQQETIEITYQFLQSIGDPMNPKKNPNFAYYSSAYLNLIDIYKRLPLEEQITNNQGMDFMNNAVVLELQDGVEVIRSKIISTE